MTDERIKETSAMRKAMMRPELGAFTGVVLVFAFFLIVAGDSGMFAADGIMNWGVVSAQFAIIAVGACLLMIAGEFDLSVGSMIGFAGILIAILSVQLGWPMWLSIIAAFAAVFAVALIVVSFFTPLFSSLVQRSALGGLDQGLGFLFGVARGVLLVAIAFFVYDTVITAQEITMVDQSRSAQVFERMTTRIEERNPEQALGWITRQYESLVGACAQQ